MIWSDGKTEGRNEINRRKRGNKSAKRKMNLRMCGDTAKGQPSAAQKVKGKLQKEIMLNNEKALTFLLHLLLSFSYYYSLLLPLPDPLLPPCPSVKTVSYRV